MVIYLSHASSLPFIGKTLVLLYTIIIYLQEKIILYAKMHNKNQCLYSELQNTSSVEFQLIFDWNLMLIHISSFIKVIIDKPCPGDALSAELRDFQKGKDKRL